MAQPSAPDANAEATPERAEVSPAEPTAAAPESKPSDSGSDFVPDYATLDYRVDPQITLKAKISLVAEAYAPGSLTSLVDTVERRPVLVRAPVLDADEAGAPRRPRVLCEEAKTRVAIAVDEAALQTVVRRQTFVAATPAIPSTITDATPGVHLAAGVQVVPRSEPSEGLTKVHYEGLFLSADGLVPSKSVDVVYEPGVLDDDLRRDGLLVGDVTFRATPSGPVIGRVVRGAGVANTLNVHRIGAPKDGQILVRYQERDAFIVGWVPSEAVEGYPETTLQTGSGSGGGSGSASSPSRIELRRGTLLAAPSSREVIGVVTRDGAFVCGDTCDDPLPRVRVHACGHTLGALAMPPQAASTAASSAAP